VWGYTKHGDAHITVTPDDIYVETNENKNPDFFACKASGNGDAFLTLHRASLSVMSHFVIFFAC
jgi:hypothetical protein